MTAMMKGQERRTATAAPPQGGEGQRGQGSEQATAAGRFDSSALAERLVELLGSRDLEEMADQSLAALMSDFGATAGSILLVARPGIQLRRGEIPEPLAAHLDQWESTIQQRIISGPWEVEASQSPSLFSRTVPGTGQTGLYSLILTGQEVAGSICLAFPQQLTPRGEQRRALAAYLRVFGPLLCLLGEREFLTERLAQLSLFYQMAQSMATTFDLGAVLNDTMQLATAVLDASASVVMLVDEKRQELVFEYTYGDQGSALRKQRIPLDEGIAGWVATHGAPLIVNNVAEDPRFNSRVDRKTGFLTRSVVCVPIQSRGEVIGVLEALNKRSGQGFDAEDLRLMVTTANQAAIAIENARLYQSLRDERDRIIQAQENVRRQVARNLHDGTVQFLSAIAMGLDHLERLLELKPEAARSEVESLRDLTRQATQQARLALFELRPLILETQGLIPALESYVEQLQGQELFGVHLEIVPPVPEISQPVAASIFAIVQEAVNNVKKHASARDVWIRVWIEEDWLLVSVTDNGRGFDPQAVERDYDRRGSIGLLTMRERAELIDGHLSIESRTTLPDSGTTVILRLPRTSIES